MKHLLNILKDYFLVKKTFYTFLFIAVLTETIFLSFPYTTKLILAVIEE
jgi:hypothetical protein